MTDYQDTIPSVEAMKAAVEIEIIVAIGFYQTILLAKVVQKAIEASKKD